MWKEGSQVQTITNRTSALTTVVISVPLLVAMSAVPANAHNEVRRFTESSMVSIRGGTVTPRFTTGIGQDYYETEAWQTNEQISLQELAAGDYVDFDDPEDLIAWLLEDE